METAVCSLKSTKVFFLNFGYVYSTFQSLDLGTPEINRSGESEKSDELSESDPINSRKKLIGADNECTFGPSYWCSSDEAMEQCKVRIYIQTYLKLL